MKISNKKVLITGGGSGIGLALAQRLLKEGAEVIITGRNLTKLEKAKAENPNLQIAQCDITDENQIKTLVEKLKSDNNMIDVLINNAGVFEFMNQATEDIDFKKIEKEIDIDFAGPIRMTHYFLPELKKKKESAIVNVSSGLAYVPFAEGPVYSATKAAIHSWTQSLRLQLENSNSPVKLFELLPPLVDTPMTATMDEEKMPKISPEKLADEFMKNFESDKYEIAAGASSQLKFMSRFFPKFIFKQVNK